MKTLCLSLLLATACWALPFRQSGFLDFMMEDEAGSGLPDLQAPPPREEGPVCPFRCQCHLRVTQCSDLGEPWPLPHAPRPRPATGHAHTCHRPRPRPPQATPTLQHRPRPHSSTTHAPAHAKPTPLYRRASGVT